MASAVFGITAAEVAARNGGLYVDTDTPVTTATLDAMITERESEVVGAVYGMAYSVDTISDTSEQINGIVRAVVVRLSLADLELAAGVVDSTTHAARVKDGWASIERLRQYPQDAGASRPTGDLAPQVMRDSRALATRRQAARITNGDTLGRLLYDS